MTAPASVVMEFKALTYAEAGSQTTLATPAVFVKYAAIISADENYLYVVEGGDDLHIYDISNRVAPSSVGTAAVVDNVVFNQAYVGLALDSTGQYLYVPGGATSLYTLDLTDPEIPTLAHTLTVTTASTDKRHVLVRDGSTLYLMGDSSFQKIDISTPQTPSVTSTLSASTTIGAGVERAYLTPDTNYIAFPEMNTGTPAGQIGLIDITGTPSEGTVIDLPDFDGASTVTITVSGALNFDSSIDTDRMWFVGKYTDGGNSSYFWMTYEKVGTWEASVLISDPEVASEVVPSHYLSNEPYNTRSWGVTGSEIIVEKSLDISGEGVFVSFWALDADEIFPQLVIKEGGNQTEQISDLDASPTEAFYLFNTVEIGSDFIIGIGAAQTEIIGISISIFGAVLVYIPTSVTVTDNGWQDISSDVNTASSPIISVGPLGITGSGVRDRTAQSGTMTFRLNNFNPVGAYSPGHTNQVTGFEIGAPIRLQISSTSPTPLKTKFLGRIESIKPEVTRDVDLLVSVRCVDSVDVLSKAKAKGLTVRTSITAKRIVDVALNVATGLPLTSSVTNALDDTPDAYNFAFDGLEDDEASLISEIRNAVESERGFFYFAYQNSLVGSDGGFRLENRATRINSPVFATVADGGLLRALIPEHSADVVYNRVQARVFPREQDAVPTTILFTLQNTPKLKPGEKITFTAPYTDPSEQASRASGTEMQPPKANTDYKFAANEDGSGADLIANLTVNVDFGGSSAEVFLQNVGPTGFVSLFQLKGKGLYSYEPVTAIDRDIVSIVQHGLSDIKFTLPYQEDISVAQEIVRDVLTAYSQPRTFITAARLVASKSATALDAFLDGEIGDKFFVENDVLGVDMGTTSPFVLGTSQLDGTDELADEAAVYVIHSIAFSVGQGNHIEAVWGLFPADVRL